MRQIRNQSLKSPEQRLFEAVFRGPKSRAQVSEEAFIALLPDLIAQLRPDQKTIIQHRFGSNKPTSYKELGQLLNQKPCTVSAQEYSTCTKLRRLFLETGRESLPPTQERDPENVPLEELNFSVRTYNVLKRGGIHTLADLLPKTAADLRSLRFFGLKLLLEVNNQRLELGYPPISGYEDAIKP